jgi:3-oxoacyl-[acyl-carrier-protein] synthase-1/3-oxoacyl-[acyl-carrier-protein] synthase II
MPFYQRAPADGLTDGLLAALGGVDRVLSGYAAVFAGIPTGMTTLGNRQLEHFLAAIGHRLPVCRYRRFTGEFASASAVAAVLAVSCLEAGLVPGALVGGNDIVVGPDRKILVLGTGHFLTAMEFFRQ